MSIYDRQKIEEGVRLILEGIGEDPGREGLKETPARVAEAYKEIFAGYHTEHQDLRLYDIGDENPGVTNGMVVVRDIPFYSVCEHHLLPFMGKIHVVYRPQANKVVGFSAIPRVVEAVAKRLQLQERLTKEIAQTLCEKMRVEGVLVYSEAEQLCMTMRGVKKRGARTVAVEVCGSFAQSEGSRLEALMLLNNGGEPNERS